MKTIVFMLIGGIALSIQAGYAQENKKASKEAQKMELQLQTEQLVNARTFIFIGRTALPQGGRSVNLTTRSNFMKFQPNLIESDMPYYGRVYSGGVYGGSDGGLQFSGQPEDFTVIRKKNNYQINTRVKGDNDTYKISLSVSFGGSATLTVIPNNRSTISYNGEISAPEPSGEQQ
jgi:hypothetical protein